MSLAVVLFLIFLVLKLAEIGVVADWSWVWVTCPLWIGFALALAFYLIGALVVLVTGKRIRRNIRKF